MPAPERLAVAAGFLTRLPVGRGAPGGSDVLLRAAPLFPLVGAALGAAVAGVALAGALALPPLAAGALAVAFELAITGALHADGLADSADGLGAGRDRERALAVMRDHQLGAFGACALGLDLLLKATALGALAAAATGPGVLAADASGPGVLAADASGHGALADGASGPGAAVAVALTAAAFALSRAVALPLAAALPYARPGRGTGRLLDGAGAAPAAAGALLAAAIVVAAVWLDPSALSVAPPIAAGALLAAAALPPLAVGLLARRRLGGVTGDVLGAAIQLSATGALLAAVALV